jgi:hypothetical protein
MASTGDVFISAVSSEFGAIRARLTTGFNTRQIWTKVQEYLSHVTGAPHMLGLLEIHLSQCSGAVFVVGARGGAGYPAGDVPERYRRLLPPSMPRASYQRRDRGSGAGSGVGPQRALTRAGAASTRHLCLSVFICG